MKRQRRFLRIVPILVLVLLSSSTSLAQRSQTANAIKDQIKTAITDDAVSVTGSWSPSGDPSHPTGRPPRVGPNQQVSQDQDPSIVFRSGASELAVAATANGTNIVVGWNDGEGFGFQPFQPNDPPLGLSGYGFSTDGGQTFVDGGAPPSGTTIGFGPGTQGRSDTGRYITRGDPWLAIGGAGNETFYYANLAIWEDDADLPPAGVSVHTGQFQGSNFFWNQPVLLQSPNYPDDFLDKEALVVGRRGNRTSIYVSLTNFIEVCDIPFFGFGQIELYRSLNGGSTWSRSIIQPDETFNTDPTDPNCGADGIVNQGSMPAIGPNGELYVVWERGWFAPLVGGSELPRATIAFSRSNDAGSSFSTPVEVASICSGTLNSPAAYNRTSSNDFPRIAVAQSGPHRGRVYVTYHDCSAASGGAPFGADTDVYVTYSDDGGATWSSPAPVHPVADGHKQFWPVVSVDSTGNVDVTYYDMQDVNVTPDPDDIECSVRIGGPLESPTLKQSRLTTFSDVYWSQSTDGGMTWHTPVRVTDVSTNWCEATPLNSIIPNFGDYNTSVSFGNNVFVSWADGRNAGMVDRVPTAFYARVDAIGAAPR